MKTRFSLLGIVVGSLVGFAAFGHPSSLQIPAKSDQDPEDRDSGVIRGRVFTAEGESPLARATVTLYSADGRGNERPRTVRSDSRGEYELRNLQAGKYFLRATRNGYLRQVYGRKTSSGSGRRQQGTPLSLASGQVLDSIDFKMVRGGVVEGTVVDQHNEPRSRVAVRLSSYESSRGERKLFPVGRAETDDRGRFRLFDIPPGSYYLSATPPFLHGSMGG
ncbi:MAG: carboxypeptidase-like regulatory domain-containing protein, partial [Acidobacteriota bacterium]|nr:carboxypeptidase-like regulatory domain-containing protein [Acidobacteriota bacterium]